MICNRKTIVALATMGALTTGMAAYAQGEALPNASDVFASYGASGNWTVYVNTTRGTCLAERVTDTSVLQMGITEPEIFAYLGVFTLAPTEAVSGAVNEIALQIGGRSFIGQVTDAAGNISGGFSGGYVVSQDAGFIDEVAASQSMVATVAGRDPIEIDLTGTADAIAAVRACNAAQPG